VAQGASLAVSGGFAPVPDSAVFWAVSAARSARGPNRSAHMATALDVPTVTLFGPTMRALEARIV